MMFPSQAPEIRGPARGFPYVVRAGKCSGRGFPRAGREFPRAGREFPHAGRGFLRVVRGFPCIGGGNGLSSCHSGREMHDVRVSKSEMHWRIFMKYLGIHEVPGPKSHPLIEAWINEAEKWLPKDDSETAWCGCFRGNVGMLAGSGVPIQHYRARQWLLWGRGAGLDPSLWQQGDTIIMKRPGGFHVGLFGGVDGGKMLLLGGNQNNSVCIAQYDFSSVVGCRR